MIPALVLTLLAQTPKVSAKAGFDAPYAVSIQGTTGMTPVAISGTITSSGTGDVVGSDAIYNANSVCGSVASAGELGVGFFIGSGTLAATLTPYVSTDSTNGTNGTWTATKFVDISGNTSATLVLTNPSAAQAYGLQAMAGMRYARVCTTAYTSGSATGHLVASYPQPPPPAAGADVTDRAGRVLGEITDGTNAIGVSAHPVRTDPTGTTTQPVSAASLPLPTGAATSAKQPALGTAGSASSDVITVQGIASMTALKVDGSAVTQPVSGTFWQATQPVSEASLDLSQGSTTSGQKGPLIQGAVTTAAPSYTTAQTSPLSLTTAGALRTDSSATTQPVSGTVAATQSGSWSLAANQSVNVAQINGVTPLMGNGATGTGSQRVTIASDNTAFSVKPSDGTNTVTVKAASTAPATTDTALVVTESPQVADQCPNTLAISQTASTDILTTTNKLHICSLVLVASAALTVNLIEGTGTTCATGGAALIGSTTAANGLSLAANGGFSAIAGRPWLKSKTTADHICLTMSGTGTVAGVMTYADQ